MKFVRVTSEFGIVVRKDSLVARNVSSHSVFAVFQTQSPLDESDSLLSFGPHFGEEAALALVKALEQLGLVYAEDFFMLATEIPDWCQLGASYASDS